jgi:hypothetical protein
VFNLSRKHAQSPRPLPTARAFPRRQPKRLHKNRDRQASSSHPNNSTKPSHPRRSHAHPDKTPPPLPAHVGN